MDLDLGGVALVIEFLNQDRVRIGFLGVCRSGKSWACWQTVEELLDQGYRWALIHDTVREPQYPPEEIYARYSHRYPRAIVTDLRQAGPALKAHRRIVFRHPISAGQVAALAMNLRRTAPTEKIVVVFDELDSETINRAGDWADQRVHDLYHQGRGLSILGCSQRVNGMPRGARGLHDLWFVFRLTPAECKDLVPYGLSSENLKRIPKLGRGQFVPVSLA